MGSQKTGSQLIFLVIFLLPCASLQQTPTNDVSFINQPENYCDGGNDSAIIPSSVASESVDDSGVDITWETINITRYPQVSGYEVLYWPISMTLYESQRVPTPTAMGVRILGLTPSTTYAASVRVYCFRDGTYSYGAASERIQFDTLPAEPGAIVEDISVETSYDGDPQAVLIQWEAIPSHLWNGPPYGYYVYLYSNEGLVNSAPVVYPSTRYEESDLEDGQYYVQVAPVNVAFVGLPSNLTRFVIGDPIELPPSESDDDPDFFDSPSVYIIVPGVLFFSFIIVITIVICKQSHERRKRGVTYCREINGDAIVLPTLLSPLSISFSGTTSIVQTPTSGARPLPSRPPESSMMQFVPEQDMLAFGNGLGPSPPLRKQPHPGAMPMLQEHQPPFSVSAASTIGAPIHRTQNSPNSGVPMHRTQTSPSSGGSVFSPAHTHAKPHPTSRGRAKTIDGGVSSASPYEVPEHNGSTLSRGIEPTRPSTAHAFAHPRTHFPPPPSHAPPQLIHSSVEVFSRANEVGIGPMQNTIPRAGMPPRSFSSTATNPLAGRDNLRQNRSAGQLVELDTNFEEKVYIRPPLDSSMENSINSAGSSTYRHGFLSPDKGPPPTSTYMGGDHYRGSIITTTSEFSSFSEATDPNSVPVSIPRFPNHLPPHPLSDRTRNLKASRRESDYSETSTETTASMTSGSARGFSPPTMDWDRRGTSDVGIGQRRQRSPPGGTQDSFSEVAAPHHVFKQAHHHQQPPLRAPYLSPASIVSSIAEPRPR